MTKEQAAEFVNELGVINTIKDIEGGYKITLRWFVGDIEKLFLVTHRFDEEYSAFTYFVNRELIMADFCPTALALKSIKPIIEDDNTN